MNLLESVTKVPEIPKNPKIPNECIIQKVPEIPKMPDIHKMLEGLIIAHLLKSAMLLIRKFLKFPKNLKC